MEVLALLCPSCSAIVGTSRLFDSLFASWIEHSVTFIWSHSNNGQVHSGGTGISSKRAAMITDVVSRAFPGREVAWIRKQSHRNSRVYVVGLDGEGGEPAAAVKLSRDQSPDQVSREFLSMSKFFEASRDPRVSCPEPQYHDPQNGAIVMRYVDGKSLAWALHGMMPASDEWLLEMMDLSGLALAEYHRVFRLPDGEPIRVDPHAKETDINRCLLECCDMASAGNLRFRVRPFFDFSAWNIIPTGLGVCLIDFPKSDYVSTPHMDLGRFRFGLELIKQYPPLGLFRGGWCLDRLYSRFLQSYSKETGITPGGADMDLIECFAGANILRAQDTGRKDRFHWQSRLEKLYLRTFRRGWLQKEKGGS